MFQDHFGDVLLVEGPPILQCRLDIRWDRSLPLLQYEEPDSGLYLLLGLVIGHAGPLTERGELLHHDLVLGSLLLDLPLEHRLLHFPVSSLLLVLGRALP